MSKLVRPGLDTGKTTVYISVKKLASGLEGDTPSSPCVTILMRLLDRFPSFRALKFNV